MPEKYNNIIIEVRNYNGIKKKSGVALTQLSLILRKSRNLLSTLHSYLIFIFFDLLNELFAFIFIVYNFLA